LIP
jgi:hypothetical protein